MLSNIISWDCTSVWIILYLLPLRFDAGYIYSLDRGAYSTNDKIGLMVKIENRSAVDITGSTLRVCYVVLLSSTCYYKIV